jgi:hypothetical protein
MNNNKQNSVMYFSRKSHQLFEMYSEGKITRIKLNISMTTLTQECEAMHKEEIEQAESDAKEIVIIKHCATESTKEAGIYADGYKNGYERALQLIKWQIEHLLPTAEQSINTQK